MKRRLPIKTTTNTSSKLLNNATLTRVTKPAGSCVATDCGLPDGIHSGCSGIIYDRFALS